jgi:hypothetical protein
LAVVCNNAGEHAVGRRGGLAATFSSQWLARYFINLTGPGIFKHSSESRSVWKQVHQAVRLRSQDDYGQRSIADSLLVGKTLVYGNERVETLRHGIEKRPVIEISPAHFRRRSNCVTW